MASAGWRERARENRPAVYSHDAHPGLLDELLVAHVDTYDELRDRLASALYFSLVDAFASDGLSGMALHDRALRAARVGWMRQHDFGLLEIAATLDVSERTIKSDGARVRGVVESGTLLAKARRRLPKVPLRTDEWVRPIAPEMDPPR